MGEQERNPLPERLFWRDPSQPTLPPEGVMPGTPAAVPPASSSSPSSGRHRVLGPAGSVAAGPARQTLKTSTHPAALLR